MRQTIIGTLLIFVFSSSIMCEGAQLIVAGRYWSNPPQRIFPQPIFLAHVFNPTEKTLNAGEYQVGVEINLPQTKTFVIKPQIDIPPGEMKSFPIKIDIGNKINSNSTYKFFGRFNGKTIYSDTRFFSDNSKVESNSKVIPLYSEASLYTEAPPEPPEAITPPPEIPFENELKIANKKSKGSDVVVKPSLESLEKIDNKSNVTTKQSQTIDLKDFKTIRTIDEELIVYVMKPGDTLRSVAEKYYGDPGKEKHIAEINFIDKTTSVKAGEEIIVDVLPLGGARNKPLNNNSSKENIDKTKANNTSKSANSSNYIGKCREYIIQRGDTLSIIAKKIYGSSAKAALILQANPGINARNLKVGSKIILPEVSGS